MLVLLCLARHHGSVVPRRELFDVCWGGAAVGDDSLNRTVTAIRQACDAVAPRGIAIETVPRTGYRLVVPQSRAATCEFTLANELVSAAYDCWRSGVSRPDVQQIFELEGLLARSDRDDARAWGILALLQRKAAEYADADDCAAYVHGCEEAARRALDIDPKESHARVALAGLAPLFGNWSNARRELLAIIADDPEHAPAVHDLAILEMSTGRPSAAIPLIADLLAKDPFAATFHYKRMYHLWTVGDINGAEQLAARAMQLWPQHAAIWSARFSTLLFTQRADQALRLVSDECPPAIPPAVATFLRLSAETVIALESGDSSGRAAHIDRAMKLAALGPAQAVAALLAMCALDAVDEAFEIARGYYLGQGRAAAPLRWAPGGPTITDQHRRVTQPLFIPAARRMREDPRFIPLCEDIGLAAYWEEFALVPDFLQASTIAPPIVRE